MFEKTIRGGHPVQRERLISLVSHAQAGDGSAMNELLKDTVNALAEALGYD